MRGLNSLPPVAPDTQFSIEVMERKFLERNIHTARRKFRSEPARCVPGPFRSSAMTPYLRINAHNFICLIAYVQSELPFPCFAKRNFTSPGVGCKCEEVRDFPFFGPKIPAFSLHNALIGPNFTNDTTANWAAAAQK